MILTEKQNKNCEQTSLVGMGVGIQPSIGLVSSINLRSGTVDTEKGFNVANWIDNRQIRDDALG